MTKTETAVENARKQTYFQAKQHDESIAGLYYSTEGTEGAGWLIQLSKTDWKWTFGVVFSPKENFGSVWQQGTFDELPKNVQDCVLGIYGVSSNE